MNIMLELDKTELDLICSALVGAFCNMEATHPRLHPYERLHDKCNEAYMELPMECTCDQKEADLKRDHHGIGMSCYLHDCVCGNVLDEPCYIHTKQIRFHRHDLLVLMEAMDGLKAEFPKDQACLEKLVLQFRTVGLSMPEEV